MSIMKRPQRQSGFTLVELLIVVIILAILAAIVIPQFNTSSSDAKMAALQSNLSAMRNAIELYRSQHGNFPGEASAVPASGCTGTGVVAGSGTAADATNKATAFKEQLTMYSNATGGACSTPGDGTFKYGPYLRDKLPADANGTNNNVTVGAVSDTGGWNYTPATGKIVMNSTAVPPGGSASSTYSSF